MSKAVTANEKLPLKAKWKRIGPGAIVAAGIIGPGSVTTFTLAGADWRYHALWIAVLAAFVTYIFQAPAIRLAEVSDKTLMQATRANISKSAAFIMFLAAFIGALAFQAGNFVGSGLAMSHLLPGLSVQMWASITALITLAIIWVGVYRLLENIMTAIIVLMVLAFVITAIGSTPPVGEMITEGFSLSTLGGDWMLVGALLATTVPPTVALAYSSFFSKKVSGEKPHQKRILQLGLFDLRLNTVFVGLISLAIIITSATVIYGTGVEVTSAAEMAEQLTPLLGRYAGVLFALGLFAAGISSGLYHASLQPTLLDESLGRTPNAKSPLSRVVASIVLVFPILFIWAFGGAPVELIVTAQALNAIVLPMVVIIMIILSRKTDVFKEQRYTGARFVALLAVGAITVLLGIRVLIGFFI